MLNQFRLSSSENISFDREILKAQNLFMAPFLGKLVQNTNARRIIAGVAKFVFSMLVMTIISNEGQGIFRRQQMIIGNAAASSGFPIERLFLQRVNVAGEQNAEEGNHRA
jgi:hypothetical protein